MIQLPQAVTDILKVLEQNGFEGVVVGGAVRDALLGSTPTDWDIATDALPQQVCALFPEHIETGLKHGTVTVMQNHTPVEVTTYRIDGEYIDGRRPENVAFTPSLEEDLARRDFTVNAMAYHPEYGLMDIYGGRSDLSRRLLRTVGDPDRRFGEDALRMLRAVRFAAVLSFVIDQQTFESICKNKQLIKKVSPERIQSELNRLVMADCGIEVLFFTGLADEILPGVNAPDSSIYWLPKELPLRIAKLLEGCANPKELLEALRYSNTLQNQVLSILACFKGPRPESDRDLRYIASKYGVDQAKGALRLWGMSVLEMEAVLEENPPLSVQSLEIDGNDLMELGAEGEMVGLVLNNLLEVVLGLPELNRRDKLLQLAKHLISATRRQMDVWQKEKE